MFSKSRFTVFSIPEIVSQLVLVWASIKIGFVFNQTHNIIPDFIIHVPAFFTGDTDIATITNVYLVVFFLAGVLSQLLKGPGVFSNRDRFATEYLVYLVAYTSSSMYLFLTTSINYDPQLFAAIGVFSTLGYLLLFAVWSAIQSPGFPVLRTLATSVLSVFQGLFSRSGVLVFLYFISPLILAKAYTSNQDVANVVTQIRIWFQPTSDTLWGLNNSFSSLELFQPMLVKQAPLDPQSLYILERHGRLLKVNYPEAVEYEVVLDIQDFLGAVEIENGTLGFAFHPDFGRANNVNADYIYIYYTDTRNSMQVNRLSRFSLASPDLDTRKNSEMQVLALNRSTEGFHNGGSVEFGSDGYLYLAIGEGVHPENVTNLDEMLRAGIVRIDVDPENTEDSMPISKRAANGVAQNYRIPRDNPFTDNPDVLDEFWAIGLRNPFRFSFDPATNDLWVGDVGSTTWEEVNVIEQGGNYQYPFIEGREETGLSRPAIVHGEEQGPIYTYQHNAVDRAVIGGVVYRGAKYPDLVGKYIFADNYSGNVYLLDPAGTQVDTVELVARARQFAQRGISSVVQLENGDILLTLLGDTSDPTGEIHQLVAADDVTDLGRGMNDDESETQSQDAEVSYNREVSRELYEVHCSRCHGFNGDGQSPDAAALNVALPRFDSEAFFQDKTDERLFDVIKEGGLANEMNALMPPWGQILSDQEIEHLVIYIRQFAAEE